ncbi:MAG: hypothetical protein HYV35_09030 [Lentisphaerae bacterium]|nr:hypothetical protein [Lentisphaerota bacterium]
MKSTAPTRLWFALVLRGLFLTCFFSDWAQPALGGNESIEIEYGFKGCVKDNRWFPAYLKPVPGIEQFDVTFMRTDYSGKNPRPLVVFSGNFRANPQGRGIAFCKELFKSYPTTRVQCGFQNAKGERVSKETILHPIQENDLVVLVVSDAPRQFNFLHGLYLQNKGIVRVIECTSKEFPVLWQELDCVDALILDQIQDAFSPAQSEALQNWLVVGGTVYLNLLDQNGVKLFPEAGITAQTTNCAPEVLRPFLRDKTDVLEKMPGRPIQVDRRFAILADGDNIFVAGKDAGCGRVLTIGLDWRNPVVKDRSAIEALQRNLWRNLLKLQRPVAHLQPLVATILPREVKPQFLVKPLAFFLLAYVLLVGPVNWIVLRRRKKLELSIIIIPLEAVSFAALAFAIGIALRTKEPILYEAETFLLDHVANHVVSGLSGLLTPDDRPFTLVLRDPRARMEEMDDQQRWRYTSEPPAARDLLVYGYETGPFLTNLRIETWAMRFFSTLTTTNLAGGVDAAATCDQTNLYVQVSNRLPFTIHDAHLIQRWNRARIGDIAAGATSELSMKLRPASKMPGRICPRCHSMHGKSGWFSEELCKDYPLDPKLRQFLEHLNPDLSRPIIVGWQDVDGGAVQIDRPKYISQRRRLCVIPVELQFSADEISIPEGIVTGNETASNNVAFSTKWLREVPYRLETLANDHAAILKSEERVTGDNDQADHPAVGENVDNVFFRDYYLPFYAHDLETSALRIHWCGETEEDNPQEALILAIFDWKNQAWVELARITNGEGAKTISKPECFVFGHYPVVRLKTTSTEPEPKRRSTILNFLEIAYEGRRIK